MVWIRANTGYVVSRMAGRSPVMDQVAQSIEARWRAESITVGKRSGDYESSIHVEKKIRRGGVLDRLVVADDEGAIPIEFGHVTHKGTIVQGQHLARRIAG